MKVYQFAVTVACDALDTEVVEDTLRQALVDGLPEDTLALVKGCGIKHYSEQGWKVSRKRIFNIGVAEAGDGHKAKATKDEAVTT